MAKKVRIDQLLVEHGLYATRSKAQAALMAGLIYVAGQRVDKAGTMVPADALPEIKGSDCPYVSRGGLKLERALDYLGWNVEGLRCLDLGSSTGGFTHCLLQRGAAHVVAVDVGKGQLDLKLRSDARVSVREECNARYLEVDSLPYTPDLICGDLSFISLALIFPVMARLSGPNTPIVTLIKPQFEAGPKHLRKGVVRDPLVHTAVLRQVIEQARECQLDLSGLTHSPVKGPAGNIEFLAGFRVRPDKPIGFEPDYSEIVAEARRVLSPTSSD